MSVSVPLKFIPGGIGLPVSKVFGSMETPRVIVGFVAGYRVERLPRHRCLRSDKFGCAQERLLVLTGGAIRVRGVSRAPAIVLDVRAGLEELSADHVLRKPILLVVGCPHNYGSWSARPRRP